MARPRKPDGEKLVHAKICLSPARFDQLSRVAQRNGKPLSVLLRQMVDSAFREPVTDRSVVRS